MQRYRKKNTTAFTFLAWIAFISGIVLLSVGLYNADNLELNEKGYYIAVMILTVVGAITVQKVTRDNEDDKYALEEYEEERLKSKVIVAKVEDNDKKG
ncbi:YiaA/YiaB family inner membrane protein [Bacillus massiliigorillae]|uniref:YiaA/YiaB family inner membrane protein n=1 Tax=Bacillus massiliigorillae TaxID=1243664 RepID=UPI00039F14C1|nr:YiaA/YiaB family inner membrane protein [Bacillus massiliigorillae]